MDFAFTIVKATNTNRVKGMIDFSKFDSLFKLTNYFKNDEVCKQTIIESRWGKDDFQVIICPFCGSVRVVTRKDGNFRCKDCHKNFSCLVGTIFENTKVSLVKWFLAMYFVSGNKKGISSYQLAKHIDVTQTTAWYMLQKIRTLYAQNDSEALSGTVECDEVYIGGKEKWKHSSMKTPGTQGRSTKTKTPVFGMIERGEYINSKGKKEFMSTVRAMVVEKTDRATLVPIICQFIEKDSSVYTDELGAYSKLGENGYNHHIVNHGKLEFVNEECVDIYTNSIEGFWSHFRRMILGTYHDVSDEHLQKYIDESVYRWNSRKWCESERFEDMFCKSIGLVIRWNDIKAGLRVA